MCVRSRRVSFNKQLMTKRATKVVTSTNSRNSRHLMGRNTQNVIQSMGNAPQCLWIEYFLNVEKLVMNRSGLFQNVNIIIPVNLGSFTCLFIKVHDEIVLINWKFIDMVLWCKENFQCYHLTAFSTSPRISYVSTVSNAVLHGSDQSPDHRHESS